MKKAVLYFATLVFSWGVQAFTPYEYSVQVLQKDLPRSFRWFEKIVHSQQLSQVEVYDLYQSALPETQVNQQLGISAKGSIDRMILLLEGARYFEPVQKAPLEYQNKKEIVLRILQTTKDHMDRFQYGEDPQNLLEEWKTLAVNDFEKLVIDIVEVFTETQKLVTVEPRGEALASGPTDTKASAVKTQDELAQSEVSQDEVSQDEVVQTIEATVAETQKEEAQRTEAQIVAPEESFEHQRFSSYVEAVEAGRIADECQNAQVWQTDQAESCQADDKLECDRRYARQCKKLQ